MSIIDRLFSSRQPAAPQKAEAAAGFIVPVTINPTRDNGPSFRLHRLGLPLTPHVEVKIELARPFQGIISGNSTDRGDLTPGRLARGSSNLQGGRSDESVDRRATRAPRKEG